MRECVSLQLHYFLCTKSSCNKFNLFIYNSILEDFRKLCIGIALGIPTLIAALSQYRNTFLNLNTTTTTKTNRKTIPLNPIFDFFRQYLKKDKIR